MATKDPNVPDNVTIINLGNKTPTNEKAAPAQPVPNGGEAPAPEKTPEPSEKTGPEDKGGEHTPAPGDGLRLTGVTFIKGAAKEAGKTAGPDKSDAPPAPEKKTPEQTEKSGPENRGGDPPAEKPARRGRLPKADKTDATVPKADKPGKQKAAAGIGGAGGSAKNTPAKSEAAPAPAAPEQPPQPREAPRPNGKDEIVYINLSEVNATRYQQVSDALTNR